MPNASEDPEYHFKILTRDVVDAMREWPGYKIIGIVHTHPDESGPSTFDHERLPDGYLGAVYHPQTGDSVWYTGRRIVQRKARS